MKRSIIILVLIGMIWSFLVAKDGTFAFASTSFSEGGYTYEIISEPDTSGFGKVALVGFDYKEKEFTPNGVVTYEGVRYKLNTIALRKRTGLTESYGFTDISKVIIPAEVEKIDNKTWSFGAEGLDPEYECRIVFYCDAEALSGMERIVFGEQLYSTVIEVPRDYYDKYNKIFSEKAVLFMHEPGDDYEREICGFRVSEIDGIEKRTHFIYDNNLYGILDEAKHTVKLEALSFLTYTVSSDVIRISEKVLYQGEEYTVTTIACGGAVPAEKPLYIPETVTQIEDRAIDGQCPAVFLPDSIRDLPKELFIGENRMIQYIRLPKALKYIPAGAFSQCKHLRYISIPSGIKKIGTKAFGKSVKCIYMEGDVPKNFVKSLKLIKNPNVYVKNKYVDNYNAILETRIKKGTLILKACDFSYLSDLELNTKEISVEQNKAFKLKAIVSPNTADYRIIWTHTNVAPPVSISLTGMFRYSWDTYYESYNWAVYAIDVLTGKMVVCPIVQ